MTIPRPWDICATLLLAALTAAAWRGVLQPALSRSAGEIEAAREVVAHRADSADLARQLSAAQKDLRLTRAALSVFDQPGWTDSDRSRRIELVYTAARNAGVQVEGVEPSDAERVGGRRVLPMRLSGRGEYVSILRVIADIRRNQPDVVIRTMDIVSLPGGDGQLFLTAELLWVPPAAQPGKPAIPAEAAVP